MRDHLVRVNTPAAAKTALAVWAKKDENNLDVFRLPQWCDILSVDAYTALGTPATYAEDGTVTDPGVPPTLATGRWFIVSLDREVKLPAAAMGAIKADGEREAGLKLPAGVAGLSTIWAGMRLV